jgi:hypothetical protein
MRMRVRWRSRCLQGLVRILELVHLGSGGIRHAPLGTCACDSASDRGTGEHGQQWGVTARMRSGEAVELWQTASFGYLVQFLHTYCTVSIGTVQKIELVSK